MKKIKHTHSTAKEEFLIELEKMVKELGFYGPVNKNKQIPADTPARTFKKNNPLKAKPV